jgi:hypothetical protein
VAGIQTVAIAKTRNEYVVPEIFIDLNYLVVALVVFPLSYLFVLVSGGINAIYKR